MNTNKTKHTPGPWKVCGGSTPKFKAITSNSGYVVFEMGDQFQHMENGRGIAAPSYEEQSANARLIAAAPETAAERDRLKEINAELLEALEYLEAVCACKTLPYENHPSMIEARAAIAKAKGGAQ